MLSTILRYTIYVLIFSGVVILNHYLAPFILERLRRVQARKVEKAEKQLDSLFVQVNREKLFSFYTLSPFVLGLCGFLFFHNFLITFIGVGVGMVIPTACIKYLKVQRKARFQHQLVDALTILSSSLKAGLSLIEAIEVISEEMSAPISQEFGLILRENKMGITLDESLMRLYQRTKVKELKLIINSILVAREAGGDLTKIFSRLTNGIRDNQKLKDSIRTLTMQGKLQGLIMSLLPFLFISMIVTFNPHHFDIMLQNQFGRLLLIIAVLLQITGMVLIRIFSTVRT